MAIIHERLEFETEGNAHIVEITDEIAAMLAGTGAKSVPKTGRPTTGP